MEPSFRDRRQDYATYGLTHKKHGTKTFTCQDCRQYLPYSQLASGKITSGNTPWRCIDCQKDLNQRLANHTRRIRRELARRGL